MSKKIENSTNFQGKIIFSSSDRIFQMIADTENGAIFSLLPINVLTLSTSLYSMEHVKISANLIFEQQKLKFILL